ncbi:cell wall-binding repeat-containing protein [Clostridium sporogenes]|uniref:cell wall-binding repeat-containing protein n=2 Tax=Clostridiaceae TaxID=31979 RepID=UPI0013D84A6A|nr:cell wall-binding repeat-containing protein [Clostridium sporogenes]NFP92631.1 cell wall-binding repeat-containing protein [Clostridium sporogenes]
MKKEIGIMSLFLALFLLVTNSNVYAKPNSHRLAGKDRYKTSIAIAKEGWQSSNYAILATGGNFPDALSAAPLAKKYNAPILLTQQQNLNDDVKSELERLSVKNVFIIGSSGVISNDIEKELNSMNIKTERIYGKDRYETSIEVAKKVGTNNGIIVATGENFPDALSIAPIAYKKSIPIILTQKNELPKNVKKFLNLNIYDKSYIVGSDGVISNSVYNSLKNPKRLYGADRYKTNIAIINEFKNELSLDKLYVATGRNYPDALTGSVLAGKTNSPILLVEGDTVNSSTLLFVKNNYSNINNVITLGSEGVVNDVVVKSVEEGRNISLETVYLSAEGSKFHRYTCSTLKETKISISRSTAISKGYGPCKVCKP